MKNEKSQTTMPMVPLSSIVIGKSNPRKVFDEEAIDELSQSIKEKGVIQPILLRPVGNTLELVCGERRYRASRIAGLTEIPAYIRELTDDEALEAQITENLQRKDVHPMEEAFAFKQLSAKFSIEEVAARVGKKDYFIKQRMKLSELLPEWQKLFYKNAITISDALKVAVLPVNTQKDLLKECGVDKSNIDKKHPFTIADYHFRSFSGSLLHAPFDRSDKTLDKKAGDCNSCVFNSAVANLFPEAVKSPICSNIACYKGKCDAGFNRELKSALEDPAIVFISSNYYLDDKKMEERLKKEGHVILRTDGYNGIGIQADDIDDYLTYKEDNFDDEEDNEEEFKTQYQEYVDRLTKQKEQTEKKIASGKYLKALIVDGSGKGQYKYIEIRKKATSKDTKKSVDSGKATAADIDAEIARIRDRQKRNKELDAEKVHKRIVDTLKADKDFKVLPAKFTKTDSVLLRFLLTEHINYSSNDTIKKAIGIGRNDYGRGTADKLYQGLEALTEPQMSFLVRRLIFDKYNTNLPVSNGGYMLRKLAEELGTIPIAAYETEQKERADKRQKNVDKRISELQEQKKLLKPKAETKAKVPAKKVVLKKASA